MRIIPATPAARKAALCARFGVIEYWIMNLEARVVEVFSDPDAGNSSSVVR